MTIPTLFIKLTTAVNAEMLALLPEPKAPKNWKDAEKIAAYVAEKKTERETEARYDPDLCHITGAAYLTTDDSHTPTVMLVNRDGLTERDLLMQLLALVDDAYTVSGYNLVGFELPVMARRAMALGGKSSNLTRMTRYESSRDAAFDLMRILFGKNTFKGLAEMARLYSLQPLPLPEGGLPDDLAYILANEVHLIRQLARRMEGVYLPEGFSGDGFGADDFPF